MFAMLPTLRVGSAGAPILTNLQDDASPELSHAFMAAL